VYGSTFEEAWGWNRDAIEEILVEAEEKDITIGLHTLTTCESNVILTLEDTLRMAEEIDSDALKLIIDTADQNVTEPNLYSGVKKLGDELAYVHVNDNMGEKRGDVHLPPGRGNINWEHFFKSLKEVGYDGYVLVQVHSVGYPIDVDGWALEAKQYLDAVLGKLEA
jgi:protein FrlC